MRVRGADGADRWLLSEFGDSAESGCRNIGLKSSTAVSLANVIAHSAVGLRLQLFA